MGGCLSKKQKKEVKHFNKEKHVRQIEKEHVHDVEEKEVKHLHKEKQVVEIKKEHVPDVEEKEVKHLNKEKHVKYENLIWSWDKRYDPFAKGKPQWTPYDDITSTVIETHYQRFCQGSTKEETVVINPMYKVNVKKYFQIKMDDKFCQRPIKRGKPNQRGTRPTNWRFTNDLILTKGKYDPIHKGQYTEGGCKWLGLQYVKQYGRRTITKEILLQGILDEQKIWNAPNQLNNLKLYNRAALLKKQQEAWRLIFSFHNISDESIKTIMDLSDQSTVGDAARAAILKIYTLETDLYKQLNTANCTKDTSKIKTLGPFARLLHCSLWFPPRYNCQDVKKLGEKFVFNGFTSTSAEIKVARTFAKKYAKEGKLPCIFSMKVSYDHGYDKAYLNTTELSAFPNEKEVLLGSVEWKVESVSVENGYTVIKLRDYRLDM